MVKGAKQLPDGWKQKTLKEITKLIYRYPTFYGMEHLSRGVPVIRGEHINSDGRISHDWTDYWFVSNEISNSFPRTIVELDDLIMSVRGSVGKIGIIDEALKGVQVSPNCIRISLDKATCYPKFLLYYLKSSYGKSLIQDNVNATTIQTIKASLLSQTIIPVPPLPEQERIVAKIEELFTQLEAGTSALAKVQAGLRRYKASVLKAAVSGRLVNGNSEIGHGELPDGWQLMTIDHVAESLDNKRIPVNKKEREKRHGQYPYYGANGQVDWIDDYIFDEPLVLVVEDETFTGREKPFSYKITGKTWVNNHAHVLRAKENILDTDYLNYSLAYYPFTPMTTGTTGRKKLTKSVLMAAPYSLPPLEEQRRIVAEVERRLSVARAVESTVEEALVRASRLRQAVLKSAFEGRLT